LICLKKQNLDLSITAYSIENPDFIKRDWQIITRSWHIPPTAAKCAVTAGAKTKGAGGLTSRLRRAQRMDHCEAARNIMETPPNAKSINIYY